MASNGVTTKNLVDEFVDKTSTEDFIILYDMETTGLAPKKADRIIELSVKFCYHTDDGLEELSADTWYINPGFALPDNIAELTGITDDFLKDKPFEDDVFEEIKNYFEGVPVIIGYNNHKFDDVFMDEMYKRHGLSFAPDATLDAMDIAKICIKPDEVENYKQPTIAAYYGYVPDVVHNSDDDAEALLHVVNGLLKDAASSDAYKDLIRLKAIKASPWKNPKNPKMSRLYVDCDKGQFFFDFTDLTWNVKDKNDRAQRYDFADLEKQIFASSGCRDYKDLKKKKDVMFF